MLIFRHPNWSDRDQHFGSGMAEVWDDGIDVSSPSGKVDKPVHLGLDVASGVSQVNKRKDSFRLIITIPDNVITEFCQMDTTNGSGGLRPCLRVGFYFSYRFVGVLNKLKF